MNGQWKAFSDKLGVVFGTEHYVNIDESSLKDTIVTVTDIQAFAEQIAIEIETRLDTFNLKESYRANINMDVVEGLEAMIKRYTF